MHSVDTECVRIDGRVLELGVISVFVSHGQPFRMVTQTKTVCVCVCVCVYLCVFDYKGVGGGGGRELKLIFSL